MSNYINIVQTTLAKKWEICTQYLPMDEKDWEVGVQLLTRIAMATLNAPSSSSQGSSNQEIEEKKSDVNDKSVSLELQSETVDKIKLFIEHNAYAFRIVCESGFPFSLLSTTSAEMALKHSLENHDSILLHFIKKEDSSISEEALAKRIEAFQRLQANEIPKAYSQFNYAYVRGDHSAGYYLLCLIQQTTGCTFNMPEKEAFNASTVDDVLSFFFATADSHENVINFMKILYYRSSTRDPFLYEQTLKRNSYLAFLNWVDTQLSHLPLDTWPNQTDIITNLLKTSTLQGKQVIAQALAANQGTTTSQVGRNLLAILAATSLREVLPPTYALMELLPEFNTNDVKNIFGFEILQFRSDQSIFKEDPRFTKRLKFNEMTKVFIHDSLMIGVYDPRKDFNGKRMPPSLLAYNMHTEKMVWGTPLAPPENPHERAGIYNLQKVGEYLLLQFIKDKKIYFIHPETGEFASTIALPAACKDPHISPQGFTYQRVEREGDCILLGGKITDHQWQPTFESKLLSEGELLPLSTHCGFHDFNRLVLYGPTGDQEIIQNCFSAEAQDDKLYTIEKDPATGECLLNIRTLKTDRNVISGIETTLPLRVKEASFGKFCQNDCLVLFAEDDAGKSPFFIDLNSLNVKYSQYKFSSYSQYIINTASAEVWIWNGESKEIWKVSAEKMTLLGSWDFSPSTTFLHVDSEDQLYFALIGN